MSKSVLQEPVFYAFDLLWLDCADLKDAPLIERKNRLSEFVQSSGCNWLLYAHHIEEHGRHFFQRNLRARFGRHRCQAQNEHLQAWWKPLAEDQEQSALACRGATRAAHEAEVAYGVLALPQCSDFSVAGVETTKRLILTLRP